MKRIGTAAAGFLACTTLAAAQPAPPSFADLAERLADTVVNISTTQVVQRHAPALPPGFAAPPGFEDFFRQFFGDMQLPPAVRHSLGSGFILSPDGYIVTNNHVIEGADEIVVKLHDGRSFKAKIVGTDPKLDVALLKIPARGLPAARLGDSDRVRVGDWVIAIGNPFGLSFTVTAGIISAKGRVIGAGPYDDFLQTDAAINPGNSGGPLFDTEGRVIGINTAIYTRSGGNNGIGFAIPINVARPVIEQLRATGHVVRAYLGVFIREVDEQAAKALGLARPEGALVQRVVKGSAAEKAGIRPGDVIVAVDGHPVKNAHDLPKRIALRRPGERVRLRVVRDGKAREIVAVLDRMPEEGAPRAARGGVRLGLVVAELTPAERRRLDTAAEFGVVVRRVAPGSPAARAGIEPGDVIYLVNGRKIRHVQDFEEVVSRAAPGSVLRIMLDRHGDAVFLLLELPPR